MQALNSLTITTTSPTENDRFSSENLDRIVNYYETIISEGNEDSYNYWYLGLAYLLQQREIDAQATWFIPFDEASELTSLALTRAIRFARSICGSRTYYR